ncbi:hypothetical protein PLEOSDRAFT_1096295 [Pleurotus ostreatus PC15]|uniref:F-box domain-containing protein n=1 Tax=Pleurotus ostreatus (strain PC15) TaxID=1137138 RepID=A0A067P6G7_PLEO1|nr:hypothetical protein PLEOSDRAFT_1096295 [Pleurotus ostreatus PC15]
MSVSQSKELEDYYDNRIDACLAEARLLRQQRNADCSKTKHLPAEILSRIFGCLVYCGHSDDFPLQWIAATHVCRTWRTIALNEPTLWADFTDVHPKWVREMFSRSQAAPLILRLSLDSAKHLGFIFEHALAYPARIGELRVSQQPFMPRLTRPAPFLRALDIGDVDIPPNFLGGVAPRLRTLNCSGNMHLPPEASWLENLTELNSLGGVNLQASYMSKLTSLCLGGDWSAWDAASGQPCRVSVDTLLSALENMPLLQSLNLLLPNDVQQASRSRLAPVYLQHLSDVTIIFDTLEAATIFHHLRTDKIKKLVAAGLCDDNIAMIEPACRFFETFYHDGGLQYLLYKRHALEVHRIESYGVHTLVLMIEYWEYLAPSTLAGVVSMLPSCVPQILEMELDNESPLQAFALPECGTIEELRISTHYRTPLNVFQTNDTPTAPYPSLRRLELQFIDFTFTPESAALLKRWISAREPSATPELVLRDCAIWEQDFASLQDVAAVRHA